MSAPFQIELAKLKSPIPLDFFRPTLNHPTVYYSVHRIHFAESHVGAK